MHRVVAAVLAEDEVAAQADRGAQPPGDADRVEREPAAQVEHEDQTDHGHGRPDQHGGRRPRRRTTQWQPISSTGARYSSSSATPTERYCTALK